MLHYEKLDVYQVSIQFVAAAVAISEQVPKGYAALADQLRRAAWSIPLNIAEGVGKPSAPDQARFHAIARGSAMTCRFAASKSSNRILPSKGKSSSA